MSNSMDSDEVEAIELLDEAGDLAVSPPVPPLLLDVPAKELNP